MAQATQRAVKLKALTPEAERALGGRYLEIATFPFRVGRESRHLSSLFPWSDKYRSSSINSHNDLSIRERSHRHNVSRKHFLLEWHDEGLFLVDRNSTCGTIVQGKKIGGDHTGGQCLLNHHDTIIAGHSNSPYVFEEVLIESESQGQEEEEEE